MQCIQVTLLVFQVSVVYGENGQYMHSMIQPLVSIGYETDWALDKFTK